VQMRWALWKGFAVCWGGEVGAVMSHVCEGHATAHWKS
jgi:hypothetical protein